MRNSFGSAGHAFIGLAAVVGWMLALLAASMFLFLSSLGHEDESGLYGDARTRKVGVVVFTGCILSNIGVMIWAYTLGIAEGRISAANSTISDLALDPLTRMVLCVVFGGVSICMLLILQSWWVLSVLIFSVGVILVTFERSAILHFLLAALVVVSIAGTCAELSSALAPKYQNLGVVFQFVSFCAIGLGHWLGLAWLMGAGEVGLISTLSALTAVAKLSPLVAGRGE
jgi:hypothetical protein